MRSLKSCLSLSFVLLLLCSFAACSKKAPSPEEVAARNAMTDRLEQAAADPLSIQSIITENKNDVKKLHYISPWLHARIRRDDPQTLYALYMSDVMRMQVNLHRAEGKDTLSGMAYTISYQFLKHFELAGLLDAARCQDPTVLPAIANAVQSRLSSFYSKKDGEDSISDSMRWTIKQGAITYEERIADRGPNAAICSLGAEGRKALETKTAYTPGYISDADWQKKFPDILKQFQEGKL